MSKKRRRRHFAPEEKAAILRRMREPGTTALLDPVLSEDPATDVMDGDRIDVRGRVV